MGTDAPNIWTTFRRSFITFNHSTILTTKLVGLTKKLDSRAAGFDVLARCAPEQPMMEVLSTTQPDLDCHWGTRSRVRGWRSTAARFGIRAKQPCREFPNLFLLRLPNELYFGGLICGFF